MEGTNIKGGGFIVARKLFNSELWLYKPASWIKLWLYILGRVSYETKGKLAKGEGFFMFSKEYREIGQDITIDIIKKASSYFRRTAMISTRRSTRGMYIKVNNYAKYQGLVNYTSTDIGTKKAPEKHAGITITKEINNITHSPKLEKRATRYMKIYNEDEPGTSFGEDQELINPPQKESSQIGANMTALIKWAIQKRGGKPFVNIQKQRNALKKLRLAKISPTMIKERWIEMEDQDFWKEKGFDFMSVAGTFDKKPI